MPARLSAVSGARNLEERELNPVDDLTLDGEAEQPVLEHYATIAAAPTATASTYNDVVAILASPLDMSVTKQREGFNKKMLNYLDGKYVIQSLNRIFGYGNWGYKATTITDMALDPDVQIPMAVSANVTLWVEFPDSADGTNHRAEFADTGFSENVKPSYWDRTKNERVYKDRTWSGYEMARKGAVTDGLKRCAANLGDQFGLSLKGTDGDGIASSEATETATTTSGNGTHSAAAPATSGWHACEVCGEELRGYTAKSGKTYTAADMAKFSIRDTGKVLCYTHKQEHLDANR